MLRKNGFRKYLQERTVSAKNIDSAVEAVKGFEECLKTKKSARGHDGQRDVKLA